MIKMMRDKGIRLKGFIPFVKISIIKNNKQNNG